MQSHLRVSSLALCATLSVFAAACEAGPDESFDELELDDEALERLELEVELVEGSVEVETLAELAMEIDAGEAPAETHSCNLNLPAHVYAGPTLNREVGGVITGIATGIYFMDAIRPSFPWLSNWRIKAGTTTVAQLNQAASMFVATGGTPIDVLMQAPPGAQPGMSYELEVRLYTSISQLACTDHITLEIADCGQVGYWASGPAPTPAYDNANCYVSSLPALPPGVTPFIWSNNWYVTPTSGTQCAVGVYDGANCYIGSAPGGHSAFFYDNNIYYTL